MGAVATDPGLRGEDWDAVDRIVRETFQSAARVRKILPAGPVATSPYVVVVPRIGDRDKGLELRTGLEHGITIIAPTRIWCRFHVKPEQLNDFAAVSQLARAATYKVAAAEDLVLTFGELLKSNTATMPPLTQTLSLWDDDKLTAGLAPDQFFTEAKQEEHGDAVDAVTAGINVLQGRSHCGPYAALMLSTLWGAASRINGTDEPGTITNLLRTGGSSCLVPDPGEPAGALPEIKKRGVLISLDSAAFDLVEVEAPHVTMDGYGTSGGLILRVEERIALRVMDPEAAVTIILSTSGKRKP